MDSRTATAAPADPRLATRYTRGRFYVEARAGWLAGHERLGELYECRSAGRVAANVALHGCPDFPAERRDAEINTARRALIEITAEQADSFRADLEAARDAFGWVKSYDHGWSDIVSAVFSRHFGAPAA